MTGKRKADEKKHRSAGDLVRPIREGASRAARLLQNFLRSRRGRRHASDILGADVLPGRLEAFQAAIESLEKHAAAFDLPVAFGAIRGQLEALLSVLLEEDDCLVSEAAGPLEDGLAATLPRVEAVFALPESFFPKLDLAGAELAAVRAAFEARDFDQARVALLARLVEKAVPEALASWLLGSSRRFADAAGLVRRGFYHLAETGWTYLEPPIRWRDLAAGDPHEHAETAILAQAYAESGDESFARDAVAHVLDWAVSVAPPPGPDGPGHAAEMGVAVGGPGEDVARSAMQGARLPAAAQAGATGGRGEATCEAMPDGGQAWGVSRTAERLLNFGASFIALRGSKAFTPEVARAFMWLVYESAEVLCGRLRASGPSAADDLRARLAASRAGAALAVTGSLFGEFAAARRWSDEGLRLLAGPAPSDSDAARPGDVLADGGDRSRSFEVHERVFEARLVGALAAGEGATGEALKTAARSMLRFEAAVLMPDGRLPGELPDGGAGEERLDRLARAAALLGVGSAGAAGPGARRSAALRGAVNGGRAEFHALAESGCFVMRTGRGRTADYMLLRTAPPETCEVPSAWQAGGAAGLHVACGGEEVLSAPFSPGNIRPASPPAAGRADAKAAAPRLLLPGKPSGGELRPSRWREGPPCDYVLAERVFPGGAVHRRETIFVERRYWVIADRLCIPAGAGASAEDEGPWVLELALPAGVLQESADGRRIVTGPGAGGLLVVLAGPTSCGFRVDSPPSELVAPAPQGARAGGPTLASAEARGRDVTFVTLLYPLHGTDPDAVTVEPVTGGPSAGQAGAQATERTVGLLLGRPGAEDLVGFPQGEEGRFGDLPPGAGAAALTRTTSAASAGGGWRTLFHEP